MEARQSEDLSSTGFLQTPDGIRIYKRSIAFLLAAAAQRCNIESLSIKESIGASLLFQVNDDTPIAESTAFSLCEAMHQLISEKIPVQRVDILRSDALAHFMTQKAKNTVELIQATCETHIPCYRCELGEPAGQFLAVAHGTLLANTGAIHTDHFTVEVVSHPFAHFRLHHATTDPLSGEFKLVATDEPTLLRTYATRKTWGSKLGLQTVTNINSAIAANKVKSVVQLSEALHDQQVVTIANRIVGIPDEESESERHSPHLVLIAGPSSSGKTTFAKRLGVVLETLGARPVVISVDSYYKAWQDIDERGMSYVDWEALSSLNLELLNENLIDLLAGKEVLVPEYDMHTSMPMSTEHWTKTQVPEGGLIIMEGIHCLNPQLTSRVPRQDKFQIMISPLSALILDDMNLISSSQVRMLRRMVRDFLYRGRSANATLKQWPSVARGERLNIYPNQNYADAVMNSGLAYEAHALKVYAEPLLKSIAPDLPEYTEARRLLSMLDRLIGMPSNIVPPQSLLREFIGGSWFYEYAGLYKNA